MGRRIGEDEAMRYMLLQNYGPTESDCPPMSQWSPADIKAHIEFQQALNAELAELGELVDAQGLAGPELAKFVVSDGISAPVSQTARTPRPRSCWPATGWWTSSRRSGPSRSRPGRRRPPGRTGRRSGSRSRCARC